MNLLEQSKILYFRLLPFSKMLFFCICFLSACQTAGAESGQKTQLVSRTARPLLSFKGIDDLSQSDRAVAEQLEIWQMLQDLYGKNGQTSLEARKVLREKVRETILEAYFDAAAIMSEAQREIVVLTARREDLLGRRDRSVNLNNATNFIASGTLNTVGSVLGFSAKTPPFPGNLNQMLSGVVSTGMSTYALKQANGGKIKGQGSSTVIAELFGRPVDSRTSYPESVWRFLHSPSPEDASKTRAEILEEIWIRHKHIEAPGSRRAALKLDLVSGLSTEKQQMSINDLNDQIAMIADLSEMTSRLIAHLRDLLAVSDSDLIE